MTFAATNDRIYHLWWHPHNFGIHLEENLDFLRDLLTHYRALNRELNFQNCTMSDCYRQAADRQGINAAKAALSAT